MRPGAGILDAHTGLQVLEGWEEIELERGGWSHVTAAVQAACGDAVGEVGDLSLI